MFTDQTDTPAGCEYATIYIVFELSKAKWQLGIMTPGTEKMSRYRIAGGDLAALTGLLAKARAKAEQSGKQVRILSCYEAGLDGHWLHRWLADNNVFNYEVDASSIEVNRRARRAKTDRIDLAQLMRSFLAYLRGEPRVCSMAHRAPAKGSVEAKAVQLAQLKAIGPHIAQLLTNEVFYRDFKNRRQVGSCVGLTDVPYDSGASHRQQGISKAGNHRARTTAIELAWLWLRHQPGSELSRWFRERVGNLKGRIRKIAIVALARKLMVALWRYLETGLVPSGAVMRPSF